MPDNFTYLSIDQPSEGIITEKGSKFIACAFPVASDAEVKTSLELVKKKHIKASHYCYAYQLGYDKTIFRIS